MFSQLTPCDASTSSIATALRSRGSPVGRRSLSLCGLRPRLGVLLTVSVPSVDSAYSAESTDGTLTKSATKTVLWR